MDLRDGERAPDGGAGLGEAQSGRGEALGDGLTIRWSTLAELRRSGLEPLLEAHWLECGTDREEVPLAVDWERYEAMEGTGLFRAIGAWRGARLVGYSGFMILPHMHYRHTLHALNDVIFVAKEVRDYGIGRALVETAEKLLVEQPPRKRGEHRTLRIIYHAKVNVPTSYGRVSDLLEHLGYKHIENGHWKLLSD